MLYVKSANILPMFLVPLVTAHSPSAPLLFLSDLAAQYHHSSEFQSEVLIEETQVTTSPE